MKRLKVKDFSVIQNANLELSTLTILVGPQASGKSVLTKLIYFFLSLLRDHYLSVEDHATIKQFQEDVRRKFREWFPQSAWGDKKFVIEFEAGEYSVKIARVVSTKTGKDGISTKFSPFFCEQYDLALNFLEESEKKAAKEPSEPDFDNEVKMRRFSRKNFTEGLGKDYVGSQLFIPAGRAFFTSFGKAVSVFEHARMLDPGTIAFGRLLASIRDHRRIFRRKKTGITLSPDLIGGIIKVERDTEYVLSPDGRKIPFSALSSGQQELLPLLMTLEEYADRRLPASSKEAPRQHEFRRIIYIEEPEAHLFPSAQSDLTQWLSTLVAPADKLTELMVTTHSPYVLAKVNNLIKAGALAGTLNEEGIKFLNELVPTNAQLAPGLVGAFAIIENELRPIIDNDGLIDGEYLDGVSAGISREFSELLELESNYAR